MKIAIILLAMLLVIIVSSAYSQGNDFPIFIIATETPRPVFPLATPSGGYTNTPTIIQIPTYIPTFTPSPTNTPILICSGPCEPDYEPEILIFTPNISKTIKNVVIYVISITVNNETIENDSR